MARSTIRVDLATLGAVGPGKIRLLEFVDETGSISAAGRAMKMSYRRAWLLIDELNRLFKNPLVTTRLRGEAGGGAELTSSGKCMGRHYRGMGIEAEAAAAGHRRALSIRRAGGRESRAARSRGTDA